MALLINKLAGLRIESSEEDSEVPRLPDEYEFLELISDEGSGGVVYRCRDKNTNEIVVVKKLFTRIEIYILQNLPPHHPCIVELKKVIIHADKGEFVTMESMDADLDEYMDLTEKPLTPMETKDIMSRILDGVRFLHENQLMHRDLKPRNILVNHKDKFELKICDFGSSARFGSGRQPGFGVLGTIGYRAPEVLDEGSWPYTCAVDMWSVGCIMVEVVWKEEAFPAVESQSNVNEQIKCIHEKRPMIRDKMEAVKDSPFFTPLSPAGLDLLEKLLEMDPNKRITATQALDHPWFKQD